MAPSETFFDSDAVSQSFLRNLASLAKVEPILMRSYHWLGLFSAVLLFSTAFAQSDPDQGQDMPGKRLSKEQQRQKFHATAVTGMSSDEWLKGYQQHLKLDSESPFGGIQWRSVGPETQSGRVNVIVAPFSNPSELYVAFATGGLYRTDNDGITWTSLFDRQSAFSIGAVALSRDGKTIWVGTGEENSQRTSYAGTGVFKSTDSGKTWEWMGLPESHHIGKILINPKNEKIVYVAALGHLYSQNADRGVYKTTDGGKTWNLVLKKDEFTGAVDMVMDPRNPDVIYASMWQRDRRAWDFVESGPGSALYKTVNGGKTWTKAPVVPSGDAAGRIGLAICNSHPDTVYAFVDNQSEDQDWADADEHVPTGRLTPRRFILLDEDQIQQIDKEKLQTFLKSYDSEIKAEEVLSQIKDKKLTMEQLIERLKANSPNAFGSQVGAEMYRTDNAGKTWYQPDHARLGPFSGYYWGKVWVNPSDAQDVYAMGEALLHSTDGGKSWESVFTRAHVDYHAVWNDPRDPRKVWVGNDGGLYVSYDDGVTIKHVNNLAVGQATTLAVDNRIPYNIYIGLQDNGTMKGPSTYRPGRSNPELWKEIGGGDGSAVAVDPRKNGELVYTASQFGDHTGRNQTTGESYSARPAAPKGDPPARFNWISPILLSPHDSDIVYVGAQRLYRSFDMGQHYKPISPDLTKNVTNGNVPFSTIKDISESPIRFGLIYVGCDDGKVQMTQDGGYQWISIPTPTPDKWVTRVVASKWDEKTVYVTQSGYREDDFAPYVWKSIDYGKSWKSIVGNLPTETVNVIREDPNRKDVLYLGTDMGAYISFDGGATWEILQGGIPNTPIHDLVIQARENELVAATHARSVWVLPLERVLSITPALRKTSLKLDSIDDVSHSVTWGYDRREKWDSSPPKPPKITGTFWTKDPGKATFSIKDKNGKVIKQTTFDAVRGFNDLSLDLELTPQKTIKPKKVKISKPDDVFKDPYEDLRATYVPVGQYKLELLVGPTIVSQDWKVTK